MPALLLAERESDTKTTATGETQAGSAGEPRIPRTFSANTAQVFAVLTERESMTNMTHAEKIDEWRATHSEIHKDLFGVRSRIPADAMTLGEWAEATHRLNELLGDMLREETRPLTSGPGWALTPAR